MQNIYIRTAGAIAVVDDSEAFLEVMKLGFPRERVVTTFANPAEAVEPLTLASEVLQGEEVALNAILGTDDPVFALREALRWIRNDSRRRTIETAFIDYNMPMMNGLDLLRKIDQPRFMRVLLTGQATSDEAIEAFNEGLIDLYVQKRDGLAAELREVCERGDYRQRNLSWHRLDPVVRHAISRPAGMEVISALMTRHGVREYLLLGTPCGYVCRSADGGLGWIQFDTEESLRGCLEVGQHNRWDDTHLQRIRRREAAVPVELIDAHPDSRSMPALIAPVSVLSEHPWVGVSYFKV